jgi:hypothetical protein
MIQFLINLIAIKKDMQQIKFYIVKTKDDLKKARKEYLKNRGFKLSFKHCIFQYRKSRSKINDKS